MTFKLISFVGVLVISSVTGEECIKEERKFQIGKNSWLFGIKPIICECGNSRDQPIRKNPGRSEIGRENITNGSEVWPPYKYPWMVSVRKNDEHFCGGTIVSRRFVLSAAHCFLTWEQEIIKSLNSSMCLTSSGETVECFEDASLFKIGLRQKMSSVIRRKVPILEYIIHPEFDAEGLKNDLALIRVEKSFPCNSFLRPICLPNKISLPRPGTQFIVSGWGETEEALNSTLLEVRMQRQPEAQCRGVINTTTMHFCAGEPGQRACVGDSGGPIFHAVNGRFYIFGIASFVFSHSFVSSYGIGESCELPQFYTNVQLYTSWIVSIIGKRWGSDKIY